MNTYHKTSQGTVFLAIAAVVALTLAAAQATQATIIETDSTTSSGFTINTTGDLAYDVAPVVSGTGLLTSIAEDNGSPQPTNNPAVLTDGLFGPADPTNTTPTTVAGIQNGTIITIPLASPSDISGIETYTAWHDTGRDGQNYTASYSSDGGTGYSPLDTVAYAPSQNDAEVALASSTGSLASGVTDIQFNFENVENNGVGYSEIAIYGAAVPEPASLALLAVAGLAILVRPRKSTGKASLNSRAAAHGPDEPTSARS